ncbi:glycosyl hydrolase [Streptomyces sp. NPDC047043]|uniref:glycoside hydrolase family 26 protein n=1 Tax=Streptomyces sp. NPDC047043 TaxID=3154497 RepID=UPI0034096D76
MAPDRRRSALGRLTYSTAAVAVVTALAQGPAFPTAFAAPSPPPSPPAAPAVPPAPSGPDERRFAFGAFLDSEAEGLERLKEFSGWLGGAELRVGHTYLPGDLWSNIEGAHNFLDSWAKWRRAKADRLLVLNVPLMERNEEGVSDMGVRRLLRRAAAGAFDDHFRVLAQRLVDLGATDTVLVLGWEMNGITYTHRCGPDPENWKRYWRRIVTVMRSVPGQKFRFDFNPNRGRDAIPWPECYPGDDVVDVIGMDSYDQPRGMSFDEEVSEPYGLQFHVDFARAHGKPISYPEWGLYRNGDNDEYMLRMLAWMDEHKPLYNTITDYCPHGVWLCSDNPRSSALYRAVLTANLRPQPTPGPSVPLPNPPTAPAAPTPPTVPAVPVPTPAQPPTPAPTPEPTPPAKPPECTPAGLVHLLQQLIGAKSTACPH